ncbi:MAG TPA: DsbC family protein [Rhizobacter sp.]|nr:DsbC family protein [Rhizobacter sp.]
MPSVFRTLLALSAAAVSLCASVAWADEAQIRKNLPERLPKLPAIDEVSKTPIPGLYEVRIGTDVVYTDEQGNHIIQGSVVDTRTGTNLTEERVNKLTAIDFDKLPFADAVMWKKGTGARRIAVFADPNCVYCKRFEQDLQKISDITVYTFIIPILGGDSPEKSRNIWCAKEPAKVWLSWMLEGAMPPRSMGQCSSGPIERNLVLSRKHRVNGTPVIVFANGTRVPGAMNAEQIEKQLALASAAKL